MAALAGMLWGYNRNSFPSNWRRSAERRRPAAAATTTSSLARRSADAHLRGGTVRTAGGGRFRLSASRAVAPEDPQRLWRRPVRELAMLRFRLRRRAVNGGYGPTVGATGGGANASSTARTTGSGDALSSANATGGGGRDRQCSYNVQSEATPPRWPMRRRQAAERRLPRRSRRSGCPVNFTCSPPEDRQCNVERRDHKRRDGSSAVPPSSSAETNGGQATSTAKTSLRA